MTEGVHVSSKPSYRQLQAFRQTVFTFVTIFVFKTSAKTLLELTFSANTSCYCTTSHPARILPDTIHHLLLSVIEAYAILLQNLNESVRDLLTALGCVILHMIALAVFPIDRLLATFYALVTSLMGVTLRQEVDMDGLCEATGLHPNEESTINEQGPINEQDSVNEVGAISADASFADIPNGASRSATAIKLDGHTHIIPADLPPAILPISQITNSTTTPLI